MANKKLTIKDIIEEGRKWDRDQIEELRDAVKRWRKERPAYLLITLVAVITASFLAVTHDVRLIERTTDISTGQSSYQELYRIGDKLPIKQQAINLKSDVARFIACYEGYNLASVNTNLECVNALSNKRVFEQYQAMINEDGGVADQIGDLGTVNVRIGHITPLKKDENTIIAEVLLLPEGINIAKNARTVLTLTITFEYEDVPTKENILHINPHGIVITSYYRKAN